MIKELILKNAIGIKNGKLKKDKIHLKFEKYKDMSGKAMIAIIGDNGSGKSTILQSCHPYRYINDKNIKFQTLFENEEGEKTIIYDLWNTELKKMVTYKFSLIMNKGKTRAIVAILHEDGTQEILNKDEKVSSYDDIVEELIGPPEIFFKTYFRSGTESFLSNLPAGGKMMHFINVLTLTRFQKMKFEADEEVRILNDELRELKAIQERIERNIGNETVVQYENIIKGNEDKIEKIEKEYNDNIIRLTSMQNKIDEYEKNKIKIEGKERLLTSVREKLNLKRKNKDKTLSEYSDLVKTINDTEKKRDKAKATFEQLEATIKTIEDDLKNADEIEKKVQYLEQLKSERLVLSENETEYTRDLNEYVNIEATKNRLEKEKQSILKEIEVNETQRAKDCQLCESRHKTLVNRLQEIEQEIETANYPEKLSKLTSKEKELKDIITRRTKINSDIYELRDIPEIYNNIKNFRTKHSELLYQKTASQIEYNRLENEYKNATSQVDGKLAAKEEYEADIQNHNEQINILLSEIDQLKFKEEFEEDPEEILKENERLLDDKDSLRKSILIASNKKDRLETDYKEREEVLAKYDIANSNCNEYKLLQKTFDDKRGLPFLELKESCQDIEMIANELLQEIQWPFSIQFQTTKTKKVRNEKVEADDFRIIVSRPNGTDTVIEALSLGEKVIVESAISLASIIYMQRKTSNGDQICKMSVMYLDEMDGSLHKERIGKFFELLRIAHVKANCRQTIFVTHNEAGLAPFCRIELDPNEPEGFKAIR